MRGEKRVGEGRSGGVGEAESEGEDEEDDMKGDGLHLGSLLLVEKGEA